MAAPGANGKVGGCESRILEGLESLRRSQRHTDVMFVVSDGERFAAHRLLLAAQSEVFEAMFFGPLPDGNRGPIEVADIDGATFERVLHFIYAGSLGTDALTPVEVLHLLYAGKKYMLEALVDACRDAIRSNLGRYDPETLYYQAWLYEEPGLATLCVNHLVKELACSSRPSELFDKLGPELLAEIIKRDDLALPEDFIFERCVAWAKREGEAQGQPLPAKAGDRLRRALGPLFDLIRFPLMHPSYLDSEVVAQWPGLLTRDEVADTRSTQVIGPTLHKEGVVRRRRRRVCDPVVREVCLERNCACRNSDGGKCRNRNPRFRGFESGGLKLCLPDSPRSSNEDSDLDLCWDSRRSSISSVASPTCRRRAYNYWWL